MRVLLLICALGLAACAPREAAHCDVSVTREIAFSSQTDVVTARALGAACDKAVALYVVASPEGHPIWAWTAPMGHAFGTHFDIATEQEIGAFLARWAEPRLARTSDAPAWSREIATSLDAATYEEVRARDLPMLCHLSGVARETCVFWEPAAAGGAVLLERETLEAADTANEDNAP
jgi:hypothetical protein